MNMTGLTTIPKDYINKNKIYKKVISEKSPGSYVNDYELVFV